MRIVKTRKRLAWEVSFFVYGCLMQLLLLLRWLPLVNSPPVMLKSSLDVPVFVVIGGLAVGWLMRTLLDKILQLSKIQAWGVVAFAGAYGALASAVSLTIFCIFVTIVSTFDVTRSATEFPLNLFFSLLGFATATLATVRASLPFGLLSGVVASSLILWIRKLERISPTIVVKRAGVGNESLAFSIIGLITWWYPKYGAPVSVVAIVLATYTLIQSRRGAMDDKYVAWTGLLMGVADFALMCV